MRRMFTVATLVVALLAVAGAPTALGHHRSPRVAFDPGAAVDVDTEVTVTALAQDLGTDGTLGTYRSVTLYECLVGGLGAPSVDCDTPDLGVWAKVKDSSGPAHQDAVKTFTPTIGGTYGFRAVTADDHVADADLTVNSQTCTDRHNACNGIENALAKVKHNNGKSKLQELAENKFDCDIE
jgi:hypothetical protein